MKRAFIALLTVSAVATALGATIDDFKKDCDNGLGYLCYAVGAAYADGAVGVRQNWAKASEYYKKGCDLRDAHSCYRLGVSYEKGLGVRQNYRTAKEYYGQVCDRGSQAGCDAYARLNKQGY